MNDQIQTQQARAARWCERHAVKSWFLTYYGREHIPHGICAYIDNERLWAAFVIYTNANCPDIMVERMTKGIYDAHKAAMEAA